MSYQSRVKYFSLWFLINFVVFMFVFWLNHLNLGDSSFPAYFEWELKIPFVAWMILPYLGFIFLFIFPFFLIQNKNEIHILGLSFLFATMIAGIVFVVFPTERGFTRITPDGLFNGIYKFLYNIDTEANMIPSLHIEYITLYFISSISHFRNKQKQVLFGLLVGGVILSTLLTYQHHILDIVSGILVALLAYKISKEILSRHLKSNRA